MSKADLNFTHFKIFFFVLPDEEKGVAKDFMCMKRKSLANWEMFSC